MATKARSRSKTASRSQPPAGTGDTPAQADRKSAFRLSDGEVEQALRSGAHAGLLEDYFGPEQYEELQILGQQAATRTVRGGPRVFILPGIMGSKLGHPGLIFDDVLWIDPIEIALGRLAGLALPADAAQAKAVGVILFAYLKLKLRLKIAGYDAAFWPYDWRQSLDQLGRQLAASLESESATQVDLVAHSMGGLVARAALGCRSQEASDKVRRLIMLGTPNFGSFLVPQALRGTADTVRQVAALDLVHSAPELTGEVFNTFPGLYQMLPWVEKYPEIDFCDLNAWPAQGLRPRPEILARVDGVRQGLAAADARFFLIAGVNQETVVGARVEDDQFVYLSSMVGDGTVPLAFAELSDTTTYYVEESHGSLPNNSVVERAVIDLLDTGNTEVLPKQWTPTRRRDLPLLTDQSLDVAPFDGRRGSELSQREVRQVLDAFVSPLATEAAAAATPGGPVDARAPALTQDLDQITVVRRPQHRLEIRLALGGISEADSQAYVFGLFRDVEPSGLLTDVDKLVDGAISEFTTRRMFSGNVGEVFMMPTGRHPVRAQNIVIVGLGPFDRYDDDVQKLTAENVIRTLAQTKVDDFAIAVMGTDSDRSMSATLQPLLEGFLRGLQDADPEKRFRSITLCETDPDRYAAAKRELYRLASTRLFENVEVTFDEVELPTPPAVAPGVRRLRPAEEPLYLIVARERIDARSVDLRASVLTPGRKATVVTEVQSCTISDLDQQLAKIEQRSFRFQSLEAFGTELADLVLPRGILRILESIAEQRLVVVHDAFASRIPWETMCIKQHFPAVDTGLNRRYIAGNLSIAKWLEQRQVDSVFDLLLVVNPTQDLPGAEEEGTRVEELFQSHPAVHIDVLRGSDATKAAVLGAFRSGRYDAVHYAGHAFFDPADPPRSGIFCHGGNVLSGSELAGLAHLPALMFFNACEAGRIRSAQQKRQQELDIPNRLQRSAGLAEAFLRGGLANFLGTYWPVGDLPAKRFAETFYIQLLEGKPIGEALRQGRKALYEMKSLDWADYMHYGSSSFVLKKRA